MSSVRPFDYTYLSKRSLNVKTDMKGTSNVSKRVLWHWLRNEPQPFINEQIFFFFFLVVRGTISTVLWSRALPKISVPFPSKLSVWYLTINNYKHRFCLWCLCWVKRCWWRNKGRHYSWKLICIYTALHTMEKINTPCPLLINHHDRVWQSSHLHCLYWLRNKANVLELNLRVD